MSLKFSQVIERLVHWFEGTISHTVESDKIGKLGDTMKRKSTAEDVPGSVKWVEMRSAAGKPQLLVNKDVKREIFQQTAKEPCNLISIFGAARQGKSFLMNCLAGQSDVFQISNFRESCTQGIDISRHMLDLKTFSELDGGKGLSKRMKVGFVDAEGQGDRDVSYDANLVCPILLTSKCVIFNWKDSMQKDKILNHMGIMHKAAMNVAVEGELEEEGRVFGHLHLVFRDWQYANSDEKSVFNDIFKEERSVEAAAAVRNQIRRSIKEAFESITVWLFPVPTPDSAALSTKLTLTSTSDAFRAKLRDLRAKLASQLSAPTVFNGKALTGYGMAGLVGVVADVLNTGNTISPQPAWISMMKDEVEAMRDGYSEQLRQAIQEAKDALQLQSTELSSVFPSEAEAKVHVQSIIDTLQEQFRADVHALVNDLDVTTSQNVSAPATESWALLIRDLSEKHLLDHAKLQRSWSDSMTTSLTERVTQRFIELSDSLPMSSDELSQRMEEILASTLGVSVIVKAKAYKDIAERVKKHFTTSCDDAIRSNEKALASLAAERQNLLSTALNHIQSCVNDICQSFQRTSDKGIAFKQFATSLDDLYRGHYMQLKTAFEKTSSISYDSVLQELETGCFRMREQLETAYSNAYKLAATKVVDKLEERLSDNATKALDDGCVSSGDLQAICGRLLDEALNEGCSATCNWSVSPNMRREYLEEPLRLRANKVFDSVHFTNNKMMQQAKRLKQQQAEQEQQEKARAAESARLRQLQQQQEKEAAAQAKRNRKLQEQRQREEEAVAAEDAARKAAELKAKKEKKPTASVRRQSKQVIEPETESDDESEGTMMMEEEMEFDDEEEEDAGDEIEVKRSVGGSKKASSIAEQRARAKQWADDLKNKGKKKAPTAVPAPPIAKGVLVKDAKRMSIADAKAAAKQAIDARAQQRSEALIGNTASPDSDKDTGRQKKKSRK